MAGATLVTGGTGFVGLAVAERLLAEGRRVVLFGPAPLAQPLRDVAEAPGVAVVAGDIRSDADLRAALADVEIDEVVHAAAVTPGPDRERGDPETILAVNVLGTAALLQRLAGRRDLRRVVVLSSVAVYGFAPPAACGRYVEDASCPAPAALYGVSKLAAEQTALRLGELHGIDVRVIRLGPVFGPWEHRTGVRDALSPHWQAIAAARAGRSIVLPRKLGADWLYARDAAAGILAVLRAERPAHRLYNLGGGAVTDLAQWCALVARHLGAVDWRLAEAGEAPTIVHNLPRDRAPLAIDRIAADLGFRPAYGLDRAAADYLAWLAERPGVVEL